MFHVYHAEMLLALARLREAELAVAFRAAQPLQPPEPPEPPKPPQPLQPPRHRVSLRHLVSRRVASRFLGVRHVDPSTARDRG